MKPVMFSSFLTALSTKNVNVIPDFDAQDHLFHIYGLKVFTDNQMLRIEYNYYISIVHDDSRKSKSVEGSKLYRKTIGVARA
jgi:hypothetical protein